MLDLIRFYLDHPYFFLIAVSLLGACMGSFFSVVAYRLPIQLGYVTQPMPDQPKPSRVIQSISIVSPGSHCPNCLAPIKWTLNIPILGYLLSAAHCRHCHTSISLRYPFLEITTSLLSFQCAFIYGPSLELIFGLIFCWLLILLAMIDFETGLLPDILTLPLIWTGLIANANGFFTSLESALYGAIFGYLALWTLYHLHRLATGKHGMGYGDFKLLAAIGAWLGWEMLPLVIFLSSTLGILSAILGILLRKMQTNKPIPFGPFLAIGGWFSCFWGTQLLNPYIA